MQPNRTHPSLLIFPFACALLALVACKGKAPNSPDAKGGKPGAKGPIVLEAVIAAPASIALVARVPGTLSGSRDVDLKTEVGGRIAEIGFREGAKVAQGALLLRLADDDLAATVTKTQIKVGLAQNTLERKRQQQAAESISRQDLEIAEAELASCKADLALAQAMLRKTRILAPFSGTVGIRSVELGQTVAAGQLVAMLSQQDPWRLEFALPEDQAGLAKVGQELTFHSGTGDDSLSAKIVALDPMLDPLTRTRKAVAESRSRSPTLFPGQSIDISLPLARTQGIVLPTEALAFDAKGSLAWVFRGGKAVQTRIVTGLRTTDQIEARTGLHLGDTVLVVGAATLKPGAEVKIARLRSPL